MPVLNGGRPGDERAFIHKKILGAVGSIAGILPIPGAGIVGTVARTLAGGGGPARATVPRALTARPSQTSAAEKELGRNVKLGGGVTIGRRGFAPLAGAGLPCVPPFRRAPDGSCKLFLGDRPGPDGEAPMGDAVMGMHGVGVAPGIMSINRSVCGRKMVLGDDRICYNKGLSNSKRMWPKGRRPLVTGGEMNAVTIASRVGKRLDNAASKLRAQGLMKPLPKRKAAPRAHHHHPAA